MSTCPAKIRPFNPRDPLEVQCERGAHAATMTHEGVIRDYAYKGSETKLSWDGGDRRNFFGKFQPCGFQKLCTLPLKHRGNHAS